MIVHIISPLKMQWENGYLDIFKDHTVTLFRELPPTHLTPDVRLYMWCDKETVYHINKSHKACRNVVFIRRYEVYSTWINDIDWHKVDDCIVVNDELAKIVERKTGQRPHIIYNGVNPASWTWQERTHGNKIAIVGFVNQKKNMPLALQILAKLPENYELHIAGGIQDTSVMVYLDNLSRAIKRKIYHHDQIPADNMDWWLEDKNYLLSCAISEGCPNNVIEAMAKGIKPIVHNWPGAEKQFGKYVFNTIDEAVEMFDSNSSYNSTEYKELIDKNFGLDNYRKVKEVVLGYCNRIG